jgi:hypothetical protein
MRLPIQAQPVIREMRSGQVLAQAVAAWSLSGMHPAAISDLCPEGHFSCNCAPCTNMCCSNEQTCTCTDNECSCVSTVAGQYPKGTATSPN